MVRADRLDQLTDAGWAALRTHGVRTVVDLREGDEVTGAPTPPDGVERVRVPLDDTAVTAVAEARPGGVVAHRASGRNRTLVSLLLLALVGARPADIADDCERSGERLPPLFAQLGWADQAPLVRRLPRERGTAARAEILAVPRGFGLAARLREAGLFDRALGALRARLTDPPRTPAAPRR